MTNLDVCDITECDVLAVSTIVSNEIARRINDAETLALLADIFNSIGENLVMMSGQRLRRMACKMANNKQA